MPTVQFPWTVCDRIPSYYWQFDRYPSPFPIVQLTIFRAHVHHQEPACLLRFLLPGPGAELAKWKERTGILQSHRPNPTRQILLAMDPNATNSHDPGPSPSFTSATASLCSLRVYSRPLHIITMTSIVYKANPSLSTSQRGHATCAYVPTPLFPSAYASKQQPPDKGPQNNRGFGMTKSWCGNGAVNTGPLISPEAQRRGGEETTLKRRRPLRHTTCELSQAGGGQTFLDGTLPPSWPAGISALDQGSRPSPGHWDALQETG